MIHWRNGNIPGRGNVTESCGISTFELSLSSGYSKVSLPMNGSLFLAFTFFISVAENPNTQSLLTTAQ